MSTSSKDPLTIPINLCASLQKVVESSRQDPAGLRVALAITHDRHIHLPDRHILSVTDGKQPGEWMVASLGELFRGERVRRPI